MKNELKDKDGISLLKRICQKEHGPVGPNIPMHRQLMVTEQEISKMEVSPTDGCLPLLAVAYPYRTCYVILVLKSWSLNDDSWVDDVKKS